MKKPYEIYGIPEKRAGFSYGVLPEYATHFGCVDTHLTPSLTPDKIRIWGKADYWTALEAALLLAGLSPDDEDLYLVEKQERHDDDFIEFYSWAHAEKFDTARNYLFLFERFKLTPKASPIVWVKYFYEKIGGGVSPIKNTDDANEILTFEKWDHFFDLEFYEINQTKNIEKPESTRKTENLLRTLAAVAIDAYGYNPKSAKSTVPQEIADAISEQGVNIDAKTIRNWLKEGMENLPTKREKD